MRPPLENPIPLGSLYNIAKLMGLRDSGRTYRDIKQAITSGGKSSKSPEVLITPNQPRNYAEPLKSPRQSDTFEPRLCQAGPCSDTPPGRRPTCRSASALSSSRQRLSGLPIYHAMPKYSPSKNTVVCGKDYRGLWQGLPWFVATGYRGLRQNRGLWQGLPWFVARITVVCGKTIGREQGSFEAKFLISSPGSRY